jgi:hypothetical protein
MQGPKRNEVGGGGGQEDGTVNVRNMPGTLVVDVLLSVMPPYFY